jgi:hypothetical protein
VKEPKRLRDSDELPHSLREALRSLERQAPQPDAVSRIEHRLEGTLANAAHSALSFGAGVSKLLIVSIVVALAAAAAVVVPRWKSTSAPQKEARTVVEPLERPAQRAEPSTVIETPAGPAEPSMIPVQRVSPPHEPTAANRGERHSVRSSASASTRTSHASPNEITRAAKSSESPSSDQPVLKTESAARSPSEPPPSTGAARNDPTLAPNALREAETSANETEAQLLYRAKRLAAQDPARALRVVEALVERFPSGALAQERDVLAIQLHAGMGHSATAKRLAAEFRARFPNSVYLSTLSASSP